jgi:hypothetical protein
VVREGHTVRIPLEDFAALVGFTVEGVDGGHFLG